MTQARRTPRDAACTGKRSHATYAEASKACDKRGPLVAKPFRCVWCSRWHLGSVLHETRTPISKRKTGRAPRRLDFEGDEA